MGGKIFYYIYKMKFPIDLVLITLLIVLMYCQPGALGGITTSVLGRIIAVCLIAHIALAYGRNAGLLAALIFILLLHNNREGFTPKSSKKKSVKEGHASKTPSPSPSPKHPFARLTHPKTGGLSLPNKADVKKRIESIMNMNKKKKGKEGMKDIPITQSSKTDLEGRLQREPHVNSMAAKGENGGHGYSKSIKGKK